MQENISFSKKRNIEDNDPWSDVNDLLDLKPKNRLAQTDNTFAYKSKQDDQKVDDILSILNEVEQKQKPYSKTETNFNKKSDENHNKSDFFKPLEDDEEIDLGDYMNSVSNQVIASSKKIEKKPSNNPIIIDDQKIKRASLFGLGSNKEALIIGSTAKNSEQNSNNQSFANQETGFEMGNHSRRKNQKNINNTNNNNPILARPFTAPGNNEIKIGVLSNENINIEENEIIDHKKLGKPPLKSNKSLFLASEALPSPNHSQFQKELDADKLSIDLEKPLNQIRKETNNKNYNEVENYRKHCEEIRKNYEEQLKSLRLNSQQELEHEKNLKYQSIKELEEQNKREIFRLKEIHESEIKKKEEINKWEIDQIRRKFEMENEGLKRQIDEQIKLASLAEEIKKHSDKLSNISDKLSVNENGQNANKNAELYAKEQFLKELERKYNKEKELIENEKKRLYQEREAFEQEKIILRKEYQRLDELQEKLKNDESEYKKELLHEKKRYERQTSSIESDQLRLKQEYESKYREMELHFSVFEREKHDFQQNISITESKILKKLQNAEEKKAKIAQEEAELLKRKRIFEVKELELSKKIDNINTEKDRLRLEQQEFEKEAKKVQEIALQIQKESDYINNFKQNFDIEKEKIKRKQMELDSYAQALQNEKNLILREKHEIDLRSKTVDNFRFEIVKKMEEKPIYINFDKKDNNHNNIENFKSPERKFLIEKNKNIEGNKSFTNKKIPSFEYKVFNAPMYMQFLRNANDNTAVNQAYNSKEKENLIKNKVFYEESSRFKSPSPLKLY